MCTLKVEHYQDMLLIVATRKLTEYQEYINYTHTHTHTHTDDGQAMKLVYLKRSITIVFGAVTQRGLRPSHS